MKRQPASQFGAFPFTLSCLLCFVFALAEDRPDRSAVPSSTQRIVTGDLTHLQSVIAGSTATIITYVSPSMPTGSLTVYPTGTLVMGQTLSAPISGFASVWDIYVENWDPDGDGSPLLRQYRIKIDANSFLGANASPPNPGCDLIYPYDQVPCHKTCTGGPNNGLNCSNNGQCALGLCADPCPGLLGQGNDSKCGASVPGKCQWMFANTARQDWIFANLSPADYKFLQGTQTTGPVMAGVTNPGVEVLDEHQHYYGGTVILGVPACAQGTYQIELLPAETAAYGEAQPPPELPIAAFVSATLNVAESVAPTSRYLSYFRNPQNAGMGALQVEMVELMRPSPPNLPNFPAPDFSAFEGQFRYVGTPSTCVESDVRGTTFQCARLQCAPEYLDWNTTVKKPGLFISGSEIVPSSKYNLRFLPTSCQGNELACAQASPPKAYATRRYGDLVPPFQNPDPSAPLTQPDTRDIVAVLDKFRGTDGAPLLIQGDIDPGLPNNIVDIADVSATENGFRQRQYVFPGPTTCP